MRVVFMGTPQFAVPSLLALADSTDVVGVFSRPDAVSGRGGSSRPCPVASVSAQLALPLHQPRSLREADAVSAIVGMKPDLIIVAAYGLILPRVVLDAAPLGAVNVHASLLPRWRGAAPIQRAILAGDAETGVSIMRMEEGLDTGPYCLQVETTVGDASAADLTDRLAHLGADALLFALPSIADGSARWIPQDDALATYAEKISKADVSIRPDFSVEQTVRCIRVSLPAAPCRITVADRNVTVLSARPAGDEYTQIPPAGKVLCAKTGVLLGVEDGAVLIERLKPDGKAEMATVDWSRGVRNLDSATWEALL